MCAFGWIVIRALRVSLYTKYCVSKYLMFLWVRINLDAWEVLVCLCLSLYKLHSCFIITYVVCVHEMMHQNDSFQFQFRAKLCTLLQILCFVKLLHVWLSLFMGAIIIIIMYAIATSGFHLVGGRVNLPPSKYWHHHISTGLLCAINYRCSVMH